MNRLPIPRAVVAIGVALLMLAAWPASGADAQRGGALYELRCGGCHSESVHGRAKRVAIDFDDIRRWVSRWSGSLRLQWASEDIDDVTVYLNTAYYGYACPPQVCKVVSLAPAQAAPASSRTWAATLRARWKSS